MKDRGMMKWNSFNAIIAQDSHINKMMLDRKKIEKPILSSDQLNELNELIYLAIIDNKEIEIDFYKSGFILTHKGTIKNVDTYNKTVIFSDKKDINIKDITAVRII